MCSNSIEWVHWDSKNNSLNAPEMVKDPQKPGEGLLLEPSRPNYVIFHVWSSLEVSATILSEMTAEWVRRFTGYWSGPKWPLLVWQRCFKHPEQCWNQSTPNRGAGDGTHVLQISVHQFGVESPRYVINTTPVLVDTMSSARGYHHSRRNSDHYESRF